MTAVVNPPQQAARCVKGRPDRAAAEPVKLRHRHHVAGLEAGHLLGELGPIGADTACSGSWLKAIWSQPTQLRSLSLRALKRSTHFLEQSGVRHE
jgi:hypothetical protein